MTPASRLASASSALSARAARIPGRPGILLQGIATTAALIAAMPSEAFADDLLAEVRRFADAAEAAGVAGRLQPLFGELADLASLGRLAALEAGVAR